MKIFQRLTWKSVQRQTVELLFDIIGSSLYSAGIYTFISGANFAPGGVGGLSIITNHFIPAIPIGLGFILINIPVIALTAKTLGKHFLLRSLKSMICFWLVTDYVFPLFPVYSGEPLLAALFGGLLCGIGLALVYSRNSSTGGTDFIIMSLRKKFPQFSIGNISMIIDGTIIVTGGIVFGSIDAVLYGVIVTIVSAFTVDMVMTGLGAKRMVIIITKKSQEIIEGIYHTIDRGVTSLDATGTYTGESRKMLLCTCSKREAFTVKKLINNIDDKAIVFFCTVEEAYGFGFKDLKS